jgi:hypothetical protein
MIYDAEDTWRCDENVLSFVLSNDFRYADDITCCYAIRAKLFLSRSKRVPKLLR